MQFMQRELIPCHVQLPGLMVELGGGNGGGSLSHIESCTWQVKSIDAESSTHLH